MIRDRHGIRASCIEAPLVYRFRVGGASALYSETLWTLALTEIEEDIIHGPGDLLWIPGGCGEIGPWQGTGDWMFDAIRNWRTNGGTDRNRPSFSSFLGQALGVLWYLDEYLPKDWSPFPIWANVNIDGQPSPSLEVLQIPAIHNGGPSGPDELSADIWTKKKVGGVLRYCLRFAHFFTFRETVWSGKIGEIEPYRIET